MVPKLLKIVDINIWDRLKINYLKASQAEVAAINQTKQ